MENYKRIKIETFLILFLIIIFLNNLIDYNLKSTTGRCSSPLSYFPFIDF